MKLVDSWQKPLAATAIFSLFLTTPAVSTASTQTKQAFQQKETYQLAQNSTCRRVGTTDGDNLSVRKAPNGEVIGSLRNYTLVTIQGTGTAGWVQISSPQAGYVSAAYLKSCEQPVPPSQTTTSSDNCRQVYVGGVLRVRQEPSTSSPILGVLESGQRVTIKNRGKDGWVPISSPVNGYVPAIVLSSCR